jgi:hypothetical protein
MSDRLSWIAGCISIPPHDAGVDGRAAGAGFEFIALQELIHATIESLQKGGILDEFYVIFSIAGVLCFKFL